MVTKNEQHRASPMMCSAELAPFRAVLTLVVAGSLSATVCVSSRLWGNAPIVKEKHPGECIRGSTTISSWPHMGMVYYSRKPKKKTMLRIFSHDRWTTTISRKNCTDYRKQPGNWTGNSPSSGSIRCGYRRQLPQQ